MLVVTNIKSLPKNDFITRFPALGASIISDTYSLADFLTSKNASDLKRCFQEYEYDGELVYEKFSVEELAEGVIIICDSILNEQKWEKLSVLLQNAFAYINEDFGKTLINIVKEN